jgi:uncharacterized DUF497 family protein
MIFEWDETKRDEVWHKHGVDLLDAALIFENESALEIYEDRRHAGEKRFTAIGANDGVWYCVAYADRDNVRRLITAWKLNDRSKRKARARLARRSARHEEAG